MADETGKHENFLRLMEKRLRKLDEPLRVIISLSNRYNYDYDQEDVDNFFGQLQNMIDEARKPFDEGLKKVFVRGKRAQKSAVPTEEKTENNESKNEKPITISNVSPVKKASKKKESTLSESSETPEVPETPILSDEETDIDFLQKAS